MLHLAVIGYWRAENAPEWPDPGDFVDRSWRPQVRARVVEYLSGGAVLCVAAGSSWCRFRCREYGRHGLGSAELTDGTFLWPSGLAHYVAHHDIRLPDSFVAAAEANREAFVVGSAVGPDDVAVDFEWWRGQRGFGSTGGAFLTPAPIGRLIALTGGLEPSVAVLSLLRASPLPQSLSLPALRAAISARARIPLIDGVTEAEARELAQHLQTAGVATEFEAGGEAV